MNLRNLALRLIPAGIRKQIQPVDSGRSWLRIFESFTGAWQSNVTVDRDSLVTYSTVFACIARISQDVAKCRVKLVERQTGGWWKEVENPAYSPVLRKPNHYQNRVKFFEQWIISKLVHGNAYILKQRDERGVVNKLYVLDPCRVTPMVSDNGSVFYKLASDRLSSIVEDGGITVPAREIIHDMMAPLFHPLVGVSPIYACGLAAASGLKIQNQSLALFSNMARPSGMLSAPGHIADDTAARLKTTFEEKFGGTNFGKVAVLGDDLKFIPMTMNAVDAEVIAQLKWSAETVCSCFGVPPYMVHVAPPPSTDNVEALTQIYYGSALQPLIESAELCLDEGLDTGKDLGTEFDLDALLRMDTATRIKTHAEAIGAGFFTPNEARRKEDLPPVPGGDACYLQQQNFSLPALAKRDERDDPFATQPTRVQVETPPKKPDAPAEPDDDEEDDDEDKAYAEFRRSLNLAETA